MTKHLFKAKNYSFGAKNAIPPPLAPPKDILRLLTVDRLTLTR